MEKQKKVRLFVTEFVEHIFEVDENKLDKEIEKIEKSSSWKVKYIDTPQHSREHTHFNLEVE